MLQQALQHTDGCNRAHIHIRLCYNMHTGVPVPVYTLGCAHVTAGTGVCLCTRQGAHVYYNTHTCGPVHVLACTCVLLQAVHHAHGCTCACVHTHNTQVTTHGHGVTVCAHVPVGVQKPAGPCTLVAIMKMMGSSAEVFSTCTFHCLNDKKHY